MLSSDMSWHHPVSSDRQQDALHVDTYHQQPAAATQPQQQPTEWDLFTNPADFETSINAFSSSVGVSSTPGSLREPSYDLFNSAPSSFGPSSSRFRSDSAASSFDNPSPTLPNGSYDYFYSSNPTSATVSSPSSAVSTRPSTASFGYPPSATISPDAVAPPSFAELMIDRNASSSGAPASASASPEFHFGYPQSSQQQLPLHGGQQSRFPMNNFDLNVGPASPTSSIPGQYLTRQGLRHSAPGMSSYNGTAFSNGFDSSASMGSAPLVKREDISFGFPQQNPLGSAFQEGHDVQSFIRPYLERYINSTNRSAAGECSVIVMSSKVAQKSYGTEKRFLCPPPTAIMIGNHWWHENRHGDIVPPKAVISISGEPSPLDSLTEWSTPLGKNFDPNDPPAAARENGSTTFMGRCIGKQLYISDVDDRKKKVEALVKIVQPKDDNDGEAERLLGVFPSKPIKVISKPSKKRQSAKNLELCINHGSTVSLFHRLRSQTVSTKYLCVSGSHAAYKGSDGQPLPGADRAKQSAPPSFIAKTACWDSFVIYIVDVNKTTGPETMPPPPPHPDYPSPPPNAIPYNSNGAHMYTPIYYNQTVVLQCLISGVVSPVLIIRKVDHATTVVGGGLQDGVKGVPNHYCAPGEVCGDPVSQLHKIALEVYEPSKAASPATMDPNHPGTSGAFLSCMGERVNTYRPSEDRQWNGQQSDSSSSHGHSPSLPASPLVQSPVTGGNADYFASLSGGAASAASTPGLEYPPSSDGGRVRSNTNRMQKRGSLSSTPVNKGTAKSRRRVNSNGSRNNTTNSAADNAMTSGALWSVDVGETAIWTVVGTDQVRYDFYIPPTIYGSPASPLGYPQSSAGSNGIASAPSALSQPLTPCPSVVKYLPPERAQELPKAPSSSRSAMSSAAAKSMDSGHASKMLTLYGENFSKADPITVFFGSEPSPHTEVRCTEVVNCLPPASGHLAYQRPIVLVRGDGVVFPTKVMYP
ncbi:hypothetical protein FRB94_008574 [Tulasnella sp. JGI-2019a]|nr:hypothetical protein FRB94_008574 [Tulasnella sp. JGI-2019a]